MKLGRWRIVDRFVIPNLDNPDELYLTRWRILETPWFGLFIHRFDGPDSRPVLHDHPWSFVSLLVRGGYVEHRLGYGKISSAPTPRQVIRRHVRFVNVMRRDDAHFIESLDRTPTWSVLVVGKRRRTWGFLRPIPGSTRGAWSWTPFNTDGNAAEYDRAIAAREARSDG